MGYLVSPVPEIVGTNQVPHPSHVPCIREAIKRAQNRRTDVELAITRFRVIPAPEEVFANLLTLGEPKSPTRAVGSMLEDLLLERVELNQFIQDHLALLSPARRLLPDIWEEIFYWITRMDQTWTSDYDCPYRCASAPFKYSPSLAPTLLMQVCRDWQCIALAPCMWSFVQADVDRPSSFPLVDLWLRRSKCHPLSVIVCTTKDSDSQNFGVLEKLVQHSERWEAVKFDLSADGTVGILTAACGRTPILESVVLRGPDAATEINMFSVAPRLYRLVLGGIASSTVDLPWGCITNLSVTERFNQWLNVLPNLTSLEVLSLTDYEHSILDSSLEPHVLPKLHTITLSTALRLHHLTLPALRSLDICCGMYSGKRLSRSIHCFQSRSKAPIVSLTLRGFDNDEVHLESWLHEVPLLTRLSLEGVYAGASVMTDDLLLKLTHHPRCCHNLIPLLSSLVVRDQASPAAEPLSASAVLKMVRSRWETRTLRSVEVYRIASSPEIATCDPEALAKDVEGMRKEGMDITIVTVPCAQVGKRVLDFIALYTSYLAAVQGEEL